MMMDTDSNVHFLTVEQKQWVIDTGFWGASFWAIRVCHAIFTVP
jgi:hypothetical protein